MPFQQKPGHISCLKPSLSPLLCAHIRHLPYLRKDSHGAICEEAHEDKAFVGIHDIDLSHPALFQDHLDPVQELLVPRKGIIILHLLRDHKKLQRDQIKPLHREFVSQNIGDPLPGKPLLTKMFCQNRSGHFLQVTHLVDWNTAADHLFHIRRRNILRLPDHAAFLFFLIALIKPGDDLPRLIINSKTQKKENSIKCSSSIYPNACQTYKSKINSNSNNSNSNLSSYLETKLNQNTYSKNEKLLYNIFTNLSTTQEKSFQLDSSYDNINTISNNKYIKDINLQSKIKEILIKECTNISPIKKREIF